MTINIISTPKEEFSINKQNITSVRYKALGVSGKKQYTIYWRINKSYIDAFLACGCDFLNDDFACDWNYPILIIDENGTTISEKVEIVFNN